MKRIDFYIDDLLFDRLSLYLEVTNSSVTAVMRKALQEYYKEHPVEDIEPSYKSSGRKRDADVYDDELLLNKIDTDRKNTGWNRAYTIEYALVNYLDKVKAMSKEERSNQLVNIYKGHSTSVGRIDQNVYNSLKKWCKENDESMLRMTSISVLLYLEDKEEV